MKTIDNSWVLITGASSGFGEGSPANMPSKGTRGASTKRRKTLIFRCKQTTARQPKGGTKMVRIGIITCANMTNDLACSSVGCLEDSYAPDTQ